jgi:ABC-2 type transport system permease protein
MTLPTNLPTNLPAALPTNLPVDHEVSFDLDGVSRHQLHDQRSRIGSAVHAEWTKLRTVPSTAWLLAGTVLGTVALGLLVTASVNTDLCPAPTECFEDTPKLSLSGVYLGQMAVVVLAVLAMTNEYGTGMIHTTLAAKPRRWSVLAAKAVVVTAVVLGASALGVLGSLLTGRFILPQNGFVPTNGYPPLSLADGPTLRAAAGTVLYFALIGLLSLGIGAAVRDTAGALTVVVALLYLVPVLAQFVTNERVREWLSTYPPMQAGLAIQSTIGLDRLPIAPWTGLGVLGCWAAAALAAGVTVFVYRDA